MPGPPPLRPPLMNNRPPLRPPGPPMGAPIGMRPQFGGPPAGMPMRPPGPPQPIGIAPNSPQIKVGWFKEGTLFLQDIGINFEKITKPGNLLNVQVGQFDALLTVKDMDDIERIKRALSSGKGVNIKDQYLK